ncbi:MAG: ABC transporter ATP-binding protein [Dietzia sp.]
MTLVANQVTYRRPGGEFALPPTDLTVRPGQITVLVGPSGCGKTTVAHLMAGLLSPRSGSVTAGGVRVRRRRGRLPGHTALLDQDPSAASDPHLTLRRAITLPAAPRGVPVDAVDLAGEVGLDPVLLDRRPSEVSGGQLQRACLARALAQSPRYLIADEATAHLDPLSTAAIARTLRRRADAGLGVLAITHDLRLAEHWADEVVALGAGT